MTDMNTKGTKRVRFSVIDFVITLMILACLVGVAMRFDLADRLFSRTALTNGRVTFVAEAVTSEERAVFTENTIFYTDRDTFGILTGVEESPAVFYYENNLGSLIPYEHDTLLDLNGSFSAKILATEGGYLLNGNTFIAAGSTFTVKAGGASVFITIISVEAAGE